MHSCWFQNQKIRKNLTKKILKKYWNSFYCWKNFPIRQKHLLKTYRHFFQTRDNYLDCGYLCRCFWEMTYFQNFLIPLNWLVLNKVTGDHTRSNQKSGACCEPEF